MVCTLARTVSGTKPSNLMPERYRALLTVQVPFSSIVGVGT